MKLHVGNGAVLLREFVNVDLPMPHVFLAKERPDLVERFLTDESSYYGRHVDKTPDKLRGGPLTTETVTDVYGTFGFLPARPGTVSEVLSRNVFEHLSSEQATAALAECARVLKPGGCLRLDVPDPDESMKLYRESGDSFWLRHIFGPRRDQYGAHRPYNRKMLKRVVEDSGKFVFEVEEPNIHFYPSFCLRFVRT